MEVLFLALGATRRRAVVEESAQVVAGGGTAVVVIGQAPTWEREAFAPGVQVAEVSRLASQHAPVWLERLVLYRAPRFLLCRVIGHGPLRAPAVSVFHLYQRWIARRIHRRIFLPVYRRLWGELTTRTIEQYVLRGRPVQILVVADPLSVLDAARIRRQQQLRDRPAPTVCYSIDHIARAGGPT